MLNVLQNLVGRWSLSRIIYDYASETIYTASGHATFDPKKNRGSKEDVLVYHEAGILNLISLQRELRFYKSYAYKGSDNQINIYFNDGDTKGKLFQKIYPPKPKTAGPWNGTKHLCHLDTYYGIYHFKNKKEFQVQYNVEGPNKKLKIVSTYNKSFIGA